MIDQACPKCGVRTNDKGDLHCRKILVTEVRNFLSSGKEKDAIDLVLNERGDEDWEKWKKEMLKRISFEVSGQMCHFETREELDARISLEEEERECQKRRIIEEEELEAKKQKEEKEKYEIFTKISSKINENKILGEHEIEWLEENFMHEVLATYYYQHSKNLTGAWNLAKASKYYRIAGKPDKAIEITEGFSERTFIDFAADGAVYTSRGAAFRDLSKLFEAEDCALQAIKLNSKSPHPYFLLGAIYYQCGELGKGDKYFEQATSLDANKRSPEYEIQKVLQVSDVGAKNNIIDHLLQKDPEKYAWVVKFR